MARGRSGGGSRSGGGRSGGMRSSSRSSMSRSGSSFNSSRSSFSGMSSSNRSSSWSRSGSSGSFSTGRLGSLSGGSPQIQRSSAVRPSGSFTSHRPDATRPTVVRQKPGIPTGSYTHRRPLGGPMFGGGHIYLGGSPFGGGVFSGGGFESSTGQDTAEQTINENATTVPTNQPVNTGDQTAGRTGQTKKKSGCMNSFLKVAAWLLLVLLLFWVMAAPGSGSGDGFTPSTVEREKLHLKLSDEAGYCTDTCGWIDNHTVLEKGLKEFYDDTGILPYVYIIDNVEGDYDPSTAKLEQFAENAYEQLFDDGGHALLVFWDYNDAYEYVLWLGENAAELMDTEACDILFDCLDYYYYEDVSDEQFFASAFAEAGERMMRVDQTSGSRMGGALLIVGIALVIYFVYKRLQKNKAEQEARKKRAEEILNAPLEKFGDNGDVIDALEKKYEKEI